MTRELDNTSGSSVKEAVRDTAQEAKVAVAHKLAVVLHRMWRDGTDFIWSTKEAAA